MVAIILCSWDILFKLMAQKKGQGTERKISETEFVAFLRNNGGVYSRTADAITRHLRKLTGDPDASYSRQAVKYRAEQLPAEVLESIEDETWDLVAGGLQDSLQSDDQGIKLKAVALGMRYLGSKYGIVEHTVQTTKKIKVIIGNAAESTE